MGDEGELSIQQLGRALPDDWKDGELLKQVTARLPPSLVTNVGFPWA
jgi:hypothetical protein